MITWIQTVLQKHHKSVFSVLLVVIIIAFVFTVGSVPFLGNRNSGHYDAEKKSIFGYDFSNPDVARRFQTCVYFEMLTDGMRAESDEQFDIMIKRQACLLSIARSLGIESVSQAELDSYIKSRPAFMTASGSFDDGLWKKFLSEYTQQLSIDNLNSILSNNALVEKASRLVGGPGFISEKEIEKLYTSIYGTWNLSLAELSLDKFKFDKKPNESELEKFYKANSESYRIPEAFVFDVAFEPSDSYKGKVAAPSEDDLKAYYNANASNYSVSENGKFETPPLSKVLEKVKADYISSMATSMAVAKLEDAVMKIFDSKAKKDSEEVKKILSEANISLRRLDPIRADKRDTLSQLPMKALEAAVRLDDDHFYSDTIATPGGVWLVFFVKKEASFIPPFADVKKKVEEDWLSDAKMKAFTEAGAKLVENAKKAISENKSFSEVMESGGAKVEKLTNVSLTKPSPDMEKAGQAAGFLYSKLPSMKQGEVSQMFVLGNEGFVVWVSKYSEPKLDVKSEEFKKFAENVREKTAAISGAVVVQDMLLSLQKTDEEK